MIASASDGELCRTAARLEKRAVEIQDQWEINEAALAVLSWWMIALIAAFLGWIWYKF